MTEAKGEPTSNRAPSLLVARQDSSLQLDPRDQEEEIYHRDQEEEIYHRDKEEEIYHRHQEEQEGIQKTGVLQYMEAALRGPDGNL